MKPTHSISIWKALALGSLISSSAAQGTGVVSFFDYGYTNRSSAAGEFNINGLVTRIDTGTGHLFVPPASGPTIPVGPINIGPVAIPCSISSGDNHHSSFVTNSVDHFLNGIDITLDHGVDPGTQLSVSIYPAGSFASFFALAAPPNPVWSFNSPPAPTPPPAPDPTPLTTLSFASAETLFGIPDAITASFVPESSFILDPDTEYELVFENISDSRLSLLHHVSGREPIDSFGPAGFSQSDFRTLAMFTLDTIEVPEPTRALLLGIALGLAGLRRRRS